MSFLINLFTKIEVELDKKADKNQGTENAGKYWMVGSDGDLTFGIPTTDGGSSGVDGTYYVTPEMFGAVGDGATDDTEAVKEALKHKNVYASNSYLISSLITHEGNISMFGGGDFILNDATSEEFAFVFTGSDILINDISFSIPEYEFLKNTAAGNKVCFKSCDNVKIISCKFTGKNTKSNAILDFYSDWNDVLIDNCCFNVDTTYEGTTHPGGIWFRNKFASKDCSNLKIINSTFNAVSSDEAFAIWSSSDVFVRNVIIDNCIINAANMPHSLTFGNVDGLFMTSCIITLNSSTSGIKTYLDANSPSKNIRVSDCYIKSDSDVALFNVAENEDKDYFPVINNSKIVSKSFGCSRSYLNGCDITITGNKKMAVDSVLKNCKLSIIQSSNPAFAGGNIIFENCSLIKEGSASLIQYISNYNNPLNLTMKSCDVITKEGTLISPTRYEETQYIITESTFRGSSVPSFKNYTSYDIVAFNVFSTEPSYNSSGQPSGWDSNIVLTIDA